VTKKESQTVVSCAAQNQTQMQKKEPNGKKAKLKLTDLTPKKDPQGGGSYSGKQSFPIPPPGFFASSGNGMPDRHR
jgi:hypothetical protein